MDDSNIESMVKKLYDSGILVGRPEEVKEILTRVISGDSVSIVGSSGMGKTTLLLALEGLLKELNYKCIFIDCGRTRKPEEIRPKLGSNKRPIEEDVLGRILLIDGVHRLILEEFPPHYFSDLVEAGATLILTSHEPLKRYDFGDRDIKFLTSLPVVRLYPLNEDEAAELIRIFAKSYKCQELTKYTEQILKFTGGVPCLLQAVCSHLAAHISREPISKEIEKVLLPLVKMYYVYILDGLTPREERAILELAKGGRVPREDMERLKERGLLVGREPFCKGFQEFVSKEYLGTMIFTHSASSYTVRVPGYPPVELSETKFKLLKLLYDARQGETYVTFREIKQALWPGRDVDNSRVWRLVYELREKLEDIGGGWAIVTINPGYESAGYELILE